MSRQTFLLGYMHALTKLAAYDDADVAKRLQALLNDPRKFHEVMSSSGSRGLYTHIGLGNDADFKDFLTRSGKSYDEHMQRLNAFDKAYDAKFRGYTPEDFEKLEGRNFRRGAGRFFGGGPTGGHTTSGGGFTGSSGHTTSGGGFTGSGGRTTSGGWFTGSSGYTSSSGFTSRPSYHGGGGGGGGSGLILAATFGLPIAAFAATKALDRIKRNRREREKRGRA